MDLHYLIDEILPWAILIVPWALALWSKAKEKKAKAKAVRKSPSQPPPAMAKRVKTRQPRELSLTAEAVARSLAEKPKSPAFVASMPEEGVHSVDIAPMEPMEPEKPSRSQAQRELRRALVWSEILQRKF